MWAPVPNASIISEFVNIKIPNYYLSAMMNEVRKDIIHHGDKGVDFTEDRMGIMYPLGPSYAQLSIYHKTTLGDFEKAALIIQRHWNMCRSNPSYRLCKRRLLKEFEEMTLAL